MNDYHSISDLLDGLEDAGQPIQPKGGNAARVKALTFSKLGAQSGRVVPVRRRFRPMRTAAAALAAAFLLGGSVFAAWKLGAFSFAREFGPAAEVLDSHAQSYEPDSSTEAIPAAFGYASRVKAQLGGYNLVLLELSDADGQLHATVDLSPADESLPAYRDSGLTLRFADYDTTSSSRRMDAWQDRVELSATLDESLAPDAAITFSLSGAEGAPALAAFRLDELDGAWQSLAASERIHLASSAETQDYRFSLRTLTASACSVYAVVDVEAISDWGAAHLDTVPEFAVSNHTHQSGGTLLDARLVGSDVGLRRYLIGYTSNQPCNAVGDSIGFELLELFEDGDTAGHAYYLFDVELTDLVPGELTLADPTGEAAYSITWQSVRVDAMGMNLTGLEGEARYAPGRPTVELIFRDGSRETVLDETIQPDEPRSDHAAAYSDFYGWKDGSAHVSLNFRQSLDLTALAAVVVDGQRFDLDP